MDSKPLGVSNTDVAAPSTPCPTPSLPRPPLQPPPPPNRPLLACTCTEPLPCVSCPPASSQGTCNHTDLKLPAFHACSPLLSDHMHMH